MSKVYNDYGLQIKNENDPYANQIDIQSSKNTKILISNVDHINICINNHYNGRDTGSKKKSVTDTTTKTCSIKNYHNFVLSQDVFAKQSDGRLFLGTIIDVASTLCLVKFDDDTERWYSAVDLKSLNSDGTDDSPICVVCKVIKSDGKVEVCETCGRGYHKKCTHGYREVNGLWYCKLCTQTSIQTSTQTSTQTQVTTKSLKKTTKKIKSEELSLPYDVSFYFLNIFI